MDARIQASRLEGLSNIAYIPDVIDASEELRILGEVERSPRTKWTQVSGRRLQNLGGSVLPKGLIPAPLPSWLLPVIAKVQQLVGEGFYGGDAPNHVLLNAYSPGQGIMAHEDGPAYFPAVCILSLGASSIIRFYKKQAEGVCSQPTTSVLLRPRSLLVFSEEAYTGFLHGIDQVEAETVDATVANCKQSGVLHGDSMLREGERVSLTIRRVVRVFKNMFKLPS
ncbi:MAG: hypothetical protein WDW38_011615 [Sanguina aurantia]